jgi:hypothetical protein
LVRLKDSLAEAGMPCYRVPDCPASNSLTVQHAIGLQTIQILDQSAFDMSINQLWFGLYKMPALQTSNGSNAAPASATLVVK